MAFAVALPTEGVDRNYKVDAATGTVVYVALPTEGVDRNKAAGVLDGDALRSPSPRRAWIEIRLFMASYRSGLVALPTESADRNIDSASNMLPDVRRPPHGGRG